MARIRKERQSVKQFIWKIALYIRLSKDDIKEGKDESDSVENQRKILSDYVIEHFESEEYIIVDTYIDDGRTGTDVNRPDFMRMEQDIKNGKINCIIVKSLARAFRNLGDQEKFLGEFCPLYQVRFINLGLPFIDTHKNPNSISGFEVPIRGMFNEQFAASTSEEIRKTFNMKRSRGEFIGAFAPYGYKKHPDDKNRLIIDEDAASVVRDIFNWFLYGIEDNGSLSINSITRELNERGIPNPTSYKRLNGLKYQNPHEKFNDNLWSRGTVRRILQNRMYTGCMVQGKERIISYKIHKSIRTPEEEWFIKENTHEAIIDKNVFEDTQNRLQRDTRTAPGQKQIYLFSGFLRCADCGRALSRKKSKNLVYYYCRTKTQAKNICVPRSIREDILTDAVLCTVQTQIAMIHNLTQVIDNINNAPKVINQSKRLNTMLKQREDELKKLEKISDSLYADWKSGDITRDEYLRIKADYIDRINQLNEVIEKIKDDCQTISESITSENFYFKEFEKYGNIKSLQRDILVDLIDKILVYQGGAIKIEFKFADQYQQIIDFIENNERELVVIKNNLA